MNPNQISPIPSQISKSKQDDIGGRGGVDKQDSLYMLNKLQGVKKLGLDKQSNDGSVVSSISKIMSMSAEEIAAANERLDLSALHEKESISQISVAEVKTREARPQGAGKYVLRHDSKFKTYWDLFIILLVIYNCLTIPLAVAFPKMEFLESNMGIKVFENAIDVLFFADILINFRTSYVSASSGLEIVDGKRIALNYVKGRLTVDILATIPFEKVIPLFFPNKKISKRNLQLLGLLKMVRMLRLGRIVTFMKMQNNAKLAFRIGSLLGMLLLIIHWLGCVWFLVVQTPGAWIPGYDANSGETGFYEYGEMRKYAVMVYYAV